MNETNNETDDAPIIQFIITRKIWYLKVSILKGSPLVTNKNSYLMFS